MPAPASSSYQQPLTQTAEFMNVRPSSWKRREPNQIPSRNHVWLGLAFASRRAPDVSYAARTFVGCILERAAAGCEATEPTA